MPTTTTTPAPSFAALLESALTEPGRIEAAYFAFHGYSLGNQLLAMFQCEARGIQLGPIASFNRWKELGRHVSKGSKAIALCMPVTCKVKGDTPDDDATFTRFIYRNNWFVLAQTEGAEYVPQPLPGWDKARALTALEITETPFTLTDGNTQGFARAREIAVSPLAAMPEKTMFHELAHVVLGHTAEGELSDDDRTPRNIREVEAEAVAMLACAALGLPGVEFSRGYIQHWHALGESITEKNAQHIFKAADTILKAGREEPHAHERPDRLYDLDAPNRAA